MSGLVGVIAQETARFSMFPASLTGLQAPEGTGVKWIFGHDIAANQNLLVREMLAWPGYEWLWILGDDHAFSPDLLLRLLEHGADVTVPLVLQRNSPYLPVSFDAEAHRVDLADYPDDALVPLHSAGTGGMLVRRHVFEATADPWFERLPGSSPAVGEDAVFCAAAREAGASIWLDPGAHLGHCTTAVVWPVREPEGWTHGFSFMGGVQLIVPPEVRA